MVTLGIRDRAIIEIPREIIAAPSADVIAGASMTGDGILEAVTDCIKQTSK